MDDKPCIPIHPLIDRFPRPQIDYTKRKLKKSLFINLSHFSKEECTPRSKRCRFPSSARSSNRSSVTVALCTLANSVPARGEIHTVGDFMTKKDDLHVFKANTTVDDAMEALVEKRITGFPVIDDDWKLVGVVSDYDLLVLGFISGSCQNDTDLFPDVDSSWKTFNELQKLLIKNNGKVVGDLMTPNPLVVYETTNLEDAVRLLLETKYRRLPVVDNDGKLVGIVTRGDIVRASQQMKSSTERLT
ncbi:CBS domain-containing protein [Salix suchowensis]|nr:CBS domain-containing protein [Salix suchowensis]